MLGPQRAASGHETGSWRNCLPAREYSWKVALPLSTGSHPENPEHRARTTHSCGVHVHVMRAVWEGQAGEFAEHLAQTHRARGPGAEAGGSGRRGWDTQSPSLQALWGQRSCDRHAPLWAGARLPPPWPPVSPVGSDLPVPTRARRRRALTCSCRLPRTSGAPRCSARTSGTSARGAGS